MPSTRQHLHTSQCSQGVEHDVRSWELEQTAHSPAELCACTCIIYLPEKPCASLVLNDSSYKACPTSLIEDNEKCLRW